jgi:hypothetical protein
MNLQNIKKIEKIKQNFKIRTNLHSINKISTTPTFLNKNISYYRTL